MGAAEIINRALIADWRDTERLRIDEEMHALADRLIARFTHQMDEVGWRELVLPRGKMQVEILRSLESEMNRAYVRELRKIDETLASSMRLVTGTSIADRLDLVDHAGLAAGGALAIGSIVAAASAVTLSTTIVWTGVALFSWPIFIGVGAGAIATAYASPTLVARMLERMRQKGRRKIVDLVRSRLIGGPNSKPDECVRAALFTTVDNIYRRRLMEIAG